MDEPALQERFRRIERLQYVVLALLVGLYGVGLGELLGYWIAGVVGIGIAICVLVIGIAIRRHRRTSVGS